ncbi:serine/threonine-protein phosphatase 6 regulatory subunit 3 isoform X4 [Lucilia sericata]|uniref:serine/threonine-protein phosphatase 6 regulatory subunit 3 isoform X4 n=1 Tax=Lucilia sericata TaxID=13632 RepID=UPI0018A7F6EB|nr:serine/threonine-protein phosphatase 6 regulatory subunit 3 isoform X4 [Lucilia sericata]XP_037811986.1 serine/threonine-protein phosphatase 6 regulatory subunit 3 isoform X4 [Lucilia sericata]
MFWDTKDPPSHNIEILLESPDTKVEVFLDEDNIIQECKTLKKNIVNYFTRPDVIRRLIELITTEPPEEIPLSERFRHANIASEILTMGLPSLDEKLLADTDTLNMLYSYLENEPPLNPLLASFFSKTFSMLFTKKSDQDWFLYQQTCLKLLEYLKTKSSFLDLICKHFSTPIVPDLIMEMMRNVEGAQLKRSLFEWLNEERLVEKLIEIIGDPEQSEKHANVADFLCDLIHQGRTMRQDIDTFEPAFEGSNPILKNIESATTLLALFNVILQPNAVESAIVSGITVVLKIIKPVRVTDERNMERLVSYLDREQKVHDEFLTTVIRVIEPQLKQFNELLKNPPKKPDILTSAANLSPPFGMTRLQICRLFTVLLETNNEEIFKAICETDFLDILLSLFKEYCWNNFLHSEVEKCLHLIFPYSEVPNSNTNNNSTHAIVNCKIISKLIECWKINKEIESAEKGRRLGYMGHLIKIFKHITQCISESEHIGALIESNLQDDNERDLWQSIVNTTDGDLTKALSTQNKLLANHKPCDYHVSLDFFADTTSMTEAFNEVCSFLDSSDAFGRSNDDDEGEDDDNAAASFERDGGLSFYVQPQVNPFMEDPWKNCDDADDMVFDLFRTKNTEKATAFADFEAYFGMGDSSTLNHPTEGTGTETASGVTATTSSEEYDNNANVEKSSSWSGDFTTFQIPKKDTQYTSNFVDDYEDDEGMWTKPLGAAAAASTNTTVEQFETEKSVEPTNQTVDECKTNVISNGPCMSEEVGEHVPEESTSSLNQLNNSIEDNTLVDPPAEDITSNAIKEETVKELNKDLNLKQEDDEETTSKHKSSTHDTNDTETTNTNQLTTTATAKEEVSDTAATATTT